MSRLTVSSIREQNISSIYRMLLDNELERRELAKQIGISVMTVGNLVDVLKQAGVLTERKAVEKTVGRHPLLLSICDKDLYIVILEIATNSFRYILLNMACKPITSFSYFYNEDRPLDQEVETFLQLCREKTDQEAGEHVVGVGVSTSGVYNQDNDTISSVAIPELSELHVKEIVGRYFPVEITVGEDVKLAAYNYQLRRNVESMVYLYAGEGIGSGLVLNGEVYSGTGQLSGEIGQVHYKGQNFEKIACFPAFLKRVKQLFLRECKEQDPCTVASVLWQQKDEKFIELLEEYSIHFAEMLSIFGFVLAPELIVIDGNYKMFGREWVEMIRKRMPAFLLKNNDLSIELVQEDDLLPNSLKGLALQVAIRYVTML